MGPSSVTCSQEFAKKRIRGIPLGRHRVFPVNPTPLYQGRRTCAIKKTSDIQLQTI